MQPEGLKEYIAQCRQHGMTDDQIRDALRQAGWTEEQFAGEFAPAETSETPEQPPALPGEMEPASAATPPADQPVSPPGFEMQTSKRRSPVLGASLFFILTTGGAWWLYVAAQQQLPIFLPIAISALSLLLSWGLAAPGLSRSGK